MRNKSTLRDDSRRTFLKFSAAAAAVSAFRIVNEPLLASAAIDRKRSQFPPGAVVINANENPLGPCDEAKQAALSIVPQGGRYQTELTDKFEQTFARIAALPPAAVLAVFRRYGKPLAVTMPPAAPDDQRANLALPGGATAGVRVLQVRGYGDVIANDYFVLEGGDEEALAVAGPSFAGALEALARAAGVA